MPLYRVVFQEHGGYHVVCRVRAATGANHIDLAVKKIWGDAAFWVWLPGSDVEGRVYVRVDDPEEPGCDHPRTGRTTVQITPARKRLPP